MDNKYYINLSTNEGEHTGFPCLDYEKTVSGFIFYHKKDGNEIKAEIYNFADIKKIEIRNIIEGE